MEDFFSYKLNHTSVKNINRNCFTLFFFVLFVGLLEVKQYKQTKILGILNKMFNIDLKSFSF
jgi:hypothetical protein